MTVSLGGRAEMGPSTYSKLRCLYCLFLLIVPSTCTVRRMVAQRLIDKKILAQPQSKECKQYIDLPNIEYETVSVNTKQLRFSSVLRINMTWNDPDLTWNESGINKVILPVSKIWTPSLHVTNALSSSQQDCTNNVLVYRDGTVEHSIIMKTTVDCEVNLYKYPFASDACPIALNAWPLGGCGMSLRFGNVTLLNGNSGDWLTESVSMTAPTDRDDRNYIMVHISIRPFSPFVTLMVPSVLIIIADVVSFALPLGGGERISFKVTLVLSFVMFLIILNDLLPGGSQCSPLIRYHFCACLMFLVMSMLVSMMLTRLAKEGTLLCCCPPKWFNFKDSSFDDIDGKEKLGDEEPNSDISAIKENAPVEGNAALQKVVDFLEKKASQEQETDKRQRYADKVDNICFLFYLIACIVYAAIMIYMFVEGTCDIDHLTFWEDE